MGPKVSMDFRRFLRQLPFLPLPTGMHKCIPAATLLLISAASLTVRAQGFAFTNSTLAINNCKAASADERTQALSLAQDALSRYPHSMIHVHIDGLLPHQGARDESEQAMRDWDAARDLAVGYCVSASPIYLEHADKIFETWLKNFQPDFNPVDETRLEQLFLAADILSDAMPAPLHAQWIAFATTISNGYLAEIDKHAGTADARQSHRIKLAAMAAYVIADTGAIGHAESAFTSQLNANVQSDGEVAGFGKHDALHAVVYDLEPLTIAALAAHDHGENWYGITAPSGATMQMALQWLSPYAKGTDTHQEYAGTSSAADSARQQAGVPGYSGIWSPVEAAPLYLDASALDRQWADLAYQIGGKPKLWQRLEMGMS